MHDHQRPYRRIIVRRHFIESCTGNATITDDCTNGLHSIDISQRATLEMLQSPTTLQTDTVCQYFTKNVGNATITDDFADELQSVDIGRQFTITDKFADGRCEFQRAGIKCISDHVSLPIELLTNCKKYEG